MFVLDHCVQLNITHVSLPKGGTGKRCDYVDTERFLKDKRCIIQSMVNDSVEMLSISHVSDILPGIVETLLHLRFRIDVGVRGQTVNKRVGDHTCGNVYCKTCKDYYSSGHQCYMLPVDYNDRTSGYFDMHVLGTIGYNSWFQTILVQIL
jgi:hypothetical protein